MKPILFSTAMVQAILNGKKIMTRRVIKLKDFEFIESFSHLTFKTANFKRKKEYSHPYQELLLKYSIGDILYVRETFTPFGMGYLYKADTLPLFQDLDIKWEPSLFMPKVAARLFLEVTNIRVERLQDITEEDAIAEGIEKINSYLLNKYRYKDYLIKGEEWRDPIKSFMTLWQSINGKESWVENPFVFVYEFKRVEKPE